MIRILFIDTARSGAMIALAEHDSVEWRWVSQFIHPVTAGTLDFLETSLKLIQEDCPLSKMNGIVINSGPGSFTGIKLGLSFVYGLTAVNEIRTFSVSMLELVARELSRREGIAALRLVMKATSKAGYFVELRGEPDSDCVATLGKLTIQPDGEVFWKLPGPDQLGGIGDAKVFGLGDWPELRHSVKNLIQIGQFDLDSLALSAAIRAIKISWPANFEKKRALPIYVRDPAPIEK